MIILTHYGYSNYLNYTLKVARKSNFNKRLLFLGDDKNRDVAIKYGWEHFNVLESCNITSLHRRFNKSYKDVQGIRHISIRNGKNWLKYVFERWFFIYDFCIENKIKEFWHFDSDTLIIKNLDNYYYLFDKFDFSTQCNNSCLNGIVKISVVEEYCKLICELFENPEFIADQQREFDTQNPDYAFTEMRAFKIYMGKTQKKGLYLGQVIDNEIFDDCICQAHGFDIVTLPTGHKVKKIFSRGGRFYGFKKNEKIEFVTLNLSWVPTYVYKWIIHALDGKDDDIDLIRCNIINRIKNYLIKVKILFINFKKYYG